MKHLLLLAAVLLAACSGPTGPQGLDPTVLFHNAGQYAPLPYDVTFVFWDQSGQVQTTVIPWGATACIKFTATRLADSVRFVFFAGDTLTPGAAFYKQVSPWFDPATGIVAADPTAYPDGAEYWWFDWSKNPYAGTLPATPC